MDLKGLLNRTPSVHKSRSDSRWVHYVLVLTNSGIHLRQLLYNTSITHITGIG
jgi:hypothetical protein